MTKHTAKRCMGRRGFLGSAAAALGASFWANDKLEAALGNVQTASKPSDLRITDLRVAVVGRGWPLPSGPMTSWKPRWATFRRPPSPQT